MGKAFVIFLFLRDLLWVILVLECVLRYTLFRAYVDVVRITVELDTSHQIIRNISHRQFHHQTIIIEIRMQVGLYRDAATTVSPT